MACQRVETGGQFLVQTLAHLDCQAQTLGSFGFASLAEAGSPAALVLTALLTLFIAVLAFRLLFTAQLDGRDAINAVLKIGIVLTLATSWPAFRVLAYDAVLKGPAEIAASLTSPNLPDSTSGFAVRLQNVDTGITSLTAFGAGRVTGSLELEQQGDRAFQSIALEDQTAFGWGRTIFLGATIGSLAIFRMSAGLLLALTPLFAGLLLFDLARGLFSGWLRGLVLAALGALGITILLAVQVAIMEPWLAGVLERRSLGYATPNAPTELIAIALAFAIAEGGLIFVLAKVAFQSAWPVAPDRRSERVESSSTSGGGRGHVIENAPTIRPRAIAIGQSVSHLMQREEVAHYLSGPPRRAISMPVQADNVTTTGSYRGAPQPLGSSYRRTARRTTRSQSGRDRRS